MHWFLEAEIFVHQWINSFIVYVLIVVTYHLLCSHHTRPHYGSCPSSVFCVWAMNSKTKMLRKPKLAWRLCQFFALKSKIKVVGQCNSRNFRSLTHVCIDVYLCCLLAATHNVDSSFVDVSGVSQTTSGGVHCCMHACMLTYHLWVIDTLSWPVFLM